MTNFVPEGRQLAQVGLETTPGTSVVATKRISGAKIVPRGESEGERITPSGSIAPSIALEHNDWMTAALTGRPTYTELPLWLALYFEAPVTTTPGGTTPRLHTFTYSATATNTIKTVTLEEGPATGALGQKATGTYLSELGFTFSRRSLEMTGTLRGRTLQQAQTLTTLTDANAYVMQPLLGKQGDLYIAATFAGLAGASRYAGAFELTMGAPVRQGEVYTIDSSVTGYAATVEMANELTFTLSTNLYDATVGGLYTNLTTGTTLYLRLKYVGAVIETTYNYQLTLDVPLQVVGRPAQSDRDGVRQATWDLVWVKDTDPLTIAVQNNLATIA